MSNTMGVRTTSNDRESVPSADRDVANILSTLPTSGAEDDVFRLMNVYESVERVYREASAAGTPVVGASSSANP